MNVLIYAGPEAFPRSVDDATSTLRSILLPHYSVQTISEREISTQPWRASCALLVLPRCTTSLSSDASTTISEFVETGGTLLAFCAGTAVKLIDQNTSFTEIPRHSLITFYDAPGRCHIYLTFQQLENTNGPRPSQIVTLCTESGKIVESAQESMTLDFTTFETTTKTIRVLATFSDGRVAGIQHNIGPGKIMAWLPAIESPLMGGLPTIASSTPITESLPVKEQSRLEFLKGILTSIPLCIPIPSDTQYSVSHPLPQFLSSTPARSDILSIIITALAAPSPASQLSVFKDENDIFNFHRQSESKGLLQQSRQVSPVSAQWQPKHIILCTDDLPPQNQTPLFDLKSYYDYLLSARRVQGLHETTWCWGMGEALLYGEVVTSTQTMLDKNPHLLSRFPTPLVSLASFQLTGRGRGSNIWLSPEGCLQFSILLRVALADIPASKLVFVQYLFSLAVVEACREEAILGSKKGSKIRLKWPNDIYAVLDGEQGWKKVGGVLVNTSFAGGKVNVVIGCGLNVLNDEPIFSLAQLVPSEQRHNITTERALSTILCIFETMWLKFVVGRGSFDSFMDLYVERWLHSDQLVILTTVSPPQHVRVVGITPDHGLLRTIPENGRNGDKFIDLQPDGNSFDMMVGLIKSKA